MNKFFYRPVVGIDVSIIETLTTKIKGLVDEIYCLIKSNRLPESFENNVKFVHSIPGVGILTVISIMSEIGNTKGFLKAKHFNCLFWY